MFGNYIKELRERHHYSLRELGEKVGLSYSYIHAIENSRSAPSRDAVISLAHGLKVSPDELLKMAGYIPFPQEEVKEPVVISTERFADRLKQAIDTQGITIDQLAFALRLDAAMIADWIDSPGETAPPSLIVLYKLARFLNITPDYLYGCTDSPSEFSLYMPRPKNLRVILEREDIMFDDIPFDEKDKNKLKKLIYTVFGDA